MSRLTSILSLSLMGACISGPIDELPWTEDVQIDGDNPNDPVTSVGTKMCVNELGHVYVIWMDNRRNSGGSKVDIWMNRAIAAPENPASWLPTPVRVNQGDETAEGPGNVWNPDLFCNDTGAYVVWEDDRDGELQNHQIYFNKTTDNGETFLPEDLLLEFDIEGNTMSLEPRITGVGGDLMVGWYDSANGAYDIFVTTSGDQGDTWRDPIRVDSDVPAGSAYSARPKVAMSKDTDNLWVVWEDSRDGKADVYFARSDNGGVRFDADQRMDLGDDRGEADSFEPQLCTDGVNNLYVVWHDSRNNINQRDIYFNYSINKGETWLTGARQLDSDGQGANNSLYPVCVAEQDGTAHVAWMDNRNRGAFDIMYRRIQLGIPESVAEIRADIGPNPGVDDGFGNSLDLVMTYDPTSEALAVAWSDDREETAREEDNGYTDLYYQYFADGIIDNDSEQDYRIDSWYDGLGYKLDMNFQVLGNEWYAAWTDGRYETGDVYFQHRPLGDESIPPDRALIGL